MKVEACLRMVRISRWKLNIVAKEIRKKKPFEALRTLEGMRKRAAHDVHKVLLSAIANAQNNFGLDVDGLVVSEATVGRSLVLKRTDPKGKSRTGRICKEFSQVRVVLTEEKE